MNLYKYKLGLKVKREINILIQGLLELEYGLFHIRKLIFVSLKFYLKIESISLFIVFFFLTKYERLPIIKF